MERATKKMRLLAGEPSEFRAGGGVLVEVKRHVPSLRTLVLAKLLKVDGVDRISHFGSPESLSGDVMVWGFRHPKSLWWLRFASWGEQLTTLTVNDDFRTLNSHTIPRTEFYFEWDGAGLVYKIDEAAEYPHHEMKPVKRDAFYARLGNALRAIGCPPFLPEEAEIIGWFATADCVDFKGYVALSMYNALRNEQTKKHRKSTFVKLE